MPSDSIVHVCVPVSRRISRSVHWQHLLQSGVAHSPGRGRGYGLGDYISIAMQGVAFGPPFDILEAVAVVLIEALGAAQIGQHHAALEHRIAAL